MSTPTPVPASTLEPPPDVVVRDELGLPITPGAWTIADMVVGILALRPVASRTRP